MNEMYLVERMCVRTCVCACVCVSVFIRMGALIVRVADDAAYLDFHIMFLHECAWRGCVVGAGWLAGWVAD